LHQKGISRRTVADNWVTYCRRVAVLETYRARRLAKHSGSDSAPDRDGTGSQWRRSRSAFNGGGPNWARNMAISQASNLAVLQANAKENQMKGSKLRNALTFTVVLITASGCAAIQTYRKCAAGGCPDDSRITAELRSRLNQHPDLGAPKFTFRHWITLYVSVGRLLLLYSGTPSNRWLARCLASGVSMTMWWRSRFPDCDAQSDFTDALQHLSASTRLRNACQCKHSH
jgi:hypothetical protein